jgi:hypothetical protein
LSCDRASSMKRTSAVVCRSAGWLPDDPSMPGRARRMKG